MTDDHIDCPVCDGLGYLPCDDGSEIQCEHCGGTGTVSAEKTEITSPSD
jgi:DnaJ-class molecular chaperone